MSGSIRQSNLFAQEDYQKVFAAYSFIDYTAYDFDTLKQALINYIQTYYPENYNDYIESSEFIAIIELLAYFGTSLAFRTDLNSRENFIDTATRRESIIRLASMVNYVPSRNITASGLFKISSLQTNQPLIDANGNNLNNYTVYWNDPNNSDWFDQFIQITNASFSQLNPFGRPTKSGTIGSIPTDLYQLNSVTNLSVTFPITATINGQTYPIDICNPDFTTNQTIFERDPDPASAFNFIYRNDSLGVSSANTGFFLYFRQGNLINTDTNFAFPSPNTLFPIPIQNINNNDVYVQQTDQSGKVLAQWQAVPTLAGENIIYNSIQFAQRNIFDVLTDANDAITVRFADGNFGNVPTGLFRFWTRISANQSLVIRPTDVQGVQINIPYVGADQQSYTLRVTFNLEQTIANAAPSETNDQIRLRAPEVFSTQSRMVNGSDYNVLPLIYGNQIIKLTALDRTMSGQSRYIDINDPTGFHKDLIIFGQDGALYRDNQNVLTEIIQNSSNSGTIQQILINSIQEMLYDTKVNNFFYDEYLPQFESTIRVNALTVTTTIISSIVANTTGSGYTSQPTVTISGGGGNGCVATAILGNPSVTSGSGIVTSVISTSAGSGYTSSPTVSIIGGGGSGATAAAILGNPVVTPTTGVVSTATANTPGSGYISNPGVIITGGGGSGASISAVLGNPVVSPSSGVVSGILVGITGNGYQTAPMVSISGGAGSGALATAVLGNPTNSGGGFYTATSGTYTATFPNTQTTTPTVGAFSGGTVISSPTVSNITYIATVDTPPSSQVTLTNIVGTIPDGAYSEQITCIASPSNGSTVVTVNFTITNNVASLTSFSPTDSGTNQYQSGSARYTFSLGNSIDIGVSLSPVAYVVYYTYSCYITGGNFSTSPGTLNIVGSTIQPISVPGTYIAPVTSYSVTGYNIISGGTGYTSAPTLTISGGGGNGATATSIIQSGPSVTTYSVTGYNIISGGTGYTSAPTLTISGGSGSGATATATILSGTLETYSITGYRLTSGGVGYTSTPTITISGGAGTGASAITTILSGLPVTTYSVTGYTLISIGTGYVSTPTITISGGAGTGATAIAILSSTTIPITNGFSILDLNNPSQKPLYWQTSPATFHNTTGFFSNTKSSTTAATLVNTFTQNILSNGTYQPWGMINNGAVLQMGDNTSSSILTKTLNSAKINSVIQAGIPVIINPLNPYANIGPVELGVTEQSNYQAIKLYPAFRNVLNNIEIANITTAINNGISFFIYYDLLQDEWNVSTATTTGYTDQSLQPWSYAPAITNGPNTEIYSDWTNYAPGGLLYVNITANSQLNVTTYDMTARGRVFVFDSYKDVRFYWEPGVVVIDNNTGLALQDTIEIMPFINTNNSVDNNMPVVNNPSTSFLSEEVSFTVSGVYIQDDGYLDNSKVQVSLIDSNSDGIPDNPNAFNNLIAHTDRVVFEYYTDALTGYQSTRTWVSNWQFMLENVTTSLYVYFPMVNPGIDTVLYNSPFIADQLLSGTQILNPAAILGLNYSYMSETDLLFINNLSQLSYTDPTITLPMPVITIANQLSAFFNNNLSNGITIYPWLVGTQSLVNKSNILNTYFLSQSYLLSSISPPGFGVYYKLEFTATSNTGYITGTVVNQLIDASHYDKNGKSYTQNTQIPLTQQIPLYFKWSHYSPIDQRIDPSPTNIIDMVVITNSYYTDMTNWANANGTLATKPVAPTTEDLRVQFQNLDQYKMVSDSMIWNSGVFKILFGPQADQSLQATFKVVKSLSTTTTDNEIKTLVITSINQYFDIRNWAFGENFFYTELAAFIHQQLSGMISSVVIVPNNANSAFGNLFEIVANPNELFMSTANVNNVQIITSLSAQNLSN